jgi:S1-C subfamily serine protease
VLSVALALFFSSPVARDANATVLIRGTCTQRCNGALGILGAGIIIGREGRDTLLVLTARHVISRMGRPQVFLIDDGETLYGTSRLPGREARIVRVDGEHDLALIAFQPMESDRYVVASFAANPALRGNVVGHPGGNFWTVSPYAYRSPLGNRFIIACPTCGLGDSGGGVFDPDGRILGILTTELVIDGGVHNNRSTGTFTVVGDRAIAEFLGP